MTNRNVHKRKLYAERRAAGTCIRCGEVAAAIGSTRCPPCHQRVTELQRARSVTKQPRHRNPRCECGKKLDGHIRHSLKCSRYGTETFRERKSA